jgi:hypothetical protein
LTGQPQTEGSNEEHSVAVAGRFGASESATSDHTGLRISA